MHKNNGTLLVVEDDPNLLQGLSDILRLDHYQVLMAEDGMQALEILRQQGDRLPDLIVSDITMPRMDGMELLRNVRNEPQWLKIPFIFLTAKGDRSDIHQGKMMGVDDYIVKPFEADDLRVAVSSKLERHKSLDRVYSDQLTGLKRNILTILNHEFRTPLTLVVAYADMLKDYQSDAMSRDELLEFLKGVNSGAERLRHLIENFILLVELESGDAQRTFDWRKQEIYDFGELVNRAYFDAVQDIPQPPPFDFQIPTNLPHFIGDYEYLITAMRELINNAIKFSAADATIRVGVGVDGDILTFWIEDRGRGIPEHELENIWTSFYQVDREYYEDQGTGAGLALVRGIAELHGGTTSVQSTVSKGSIFFIHIPVMV
jgi:two-component system sensor histidine kinase/response regulator